jgi:GxxExxY protein
LAETRSAAALNELTKRIIGGAIEVHGALGPGLLERAYAACLDHELRLCGCAVRRNVLLPLVYKGLRLTSAYLADMIVEESVVVELKALEATAPVHARQLLTYVRLADCRVGLMLNFGQRLLSPGIVRVANRFPAKCLCASAVSA